MYPEKKNEKITGNSTAKKTVRFKRGLRMKDLTGATGLPKSAILHYLSKGLLPEPEKTGPNMAYYDPSCIERIRFIKEIQVKYSFPLSKIKVLLDSKDRGKDITPLITLNEAIFGSGDAPAIDEAAFLKITGLTSKQTRELIRSGLLIPLEKQLFNSTDVEIGKVYAQGFRQGIKVSDLMFYAEFARKIVDCEMRLRERLTSDLKDEHDAEVTKNLVQAAKAVRSYVIERTFQRRVAAARGLKDKEALIP